jgi:hypothetical protein
MIPIDWGNMALAMAALLGMVGLAAVSGLSFLANKPPKHEPRMDEPALKVFRPGRARH